MRNKNKKIKRKVIMISEKKFLATPLNIKKSYPKKCPRVHGRQGQQNKIHLNIRLARFGTLLSRIFPNRSNGAPGQEEISERDTNFSFVVHAHHQKHVDNGPRGLG